MYRTAYIIIIACSMLFAGCGFTNEPDPGVSSPFDSGFGMGMADEAGLPRDEPNVDQMASDVGLPTDAATEMVNAAAGADAEPNMGDSDGIGDGDPNGDGDFGESEDTEAPGTPDPAPEVDDSASAAGGAAEAGPMEAGGAEDGDDESGDAGGDENAGGSAEDTDAGGDSGADEDGPTCMAFEAPHLGECSEVETPFERGYGVVNGMCTPMVGCGEVEVTFFETQEECQIQCGIRSTPVPGEDCICLAVYDPVCGDDGQTYSNGCRAACAGVTETTPGECGNEKF